MVVVENMAAGFSVLEKLIDNEYPNIYLYVDNVLAATAIWEWDYNNI